MNTCAGRAPCCPGAIATDAGLLGHPLPARPVLGPAGQGTTSKAPFPCHTRGTTARLTVKRAWTELISPDGCSGQGLRHKAQAYTGPAPWALRDLTLSSYFVSSKSGVHSGGLGHRPAVAPWHPAKQARWDTQTETEKQRACGAEQHAGQEGCGGPASRRLPSRALTTTANCTPRVL